MPGARDPIEVILQTTAFADMTIGEVLQVMAEYRREHPNDLDVYNDRLMEARTRRYADISAIGVEHDLPRSYSTIEECKTFAKAVFAGARMIRTTRLPGTTAPEDITNLNPSDGVFTLGGGSSMIDGVSDDVTPTDGNEDLEQTAVDSPASETRIVPLDDSAPATKGSKPHAPKAQSMKFARPTNLKELK